MTLALTAQLDATNGPAATLAISGITGGVPVGSPVYTADWTVSLDSWTSDTIGAVPAPSIRYTPGAGAPGILDVGRFPGYTQDWYDVGQRVKRTITGLTVGHAYRATMVLNCYSGPGLNAHLAVDTLAAGDSQPITTFPTAVTTLTVDFVATATSHVLYLILDASGVGNWVRAYEADVQTLDAISGSVTVQRTDRNGTHFVRQPAGAGPDASGDMTLTDEEFALPLGGAVTYVVRDGGGNLASATLTQHGGGSSFAWSENLLGPVGTPGLVVGVERVTDYTEDREFADGSTSTLVILGRQAPLTVTRTDAVWTLRTGTLTYWCADYAEAEVIASTYEVGRVAFLRFCQTYPTDLYHVASRVSVAPLTLTTDGWTFSVEVDYTEVAWPAGDLAGAASWTFADVAADYLAFYNLPLTFATFADLLAGP